MKRVSRQRATGGHVGGCALCFAGAVCSSGGRALGGYAGRSHARSEHGSDGPATPTCWNVKSMPLPTSSTSDPVCKRSDESS